MSCAQRMMSSQRSRPTKQCLQPILGSNQTHAPAQPLFQRNFFLLANMLSNQTCVVRKKGKTHVFFPTADVPDVVSKKQVQPWAGTFVCWISFHLQAVDHLLQAVRTNPATCSNCGVRSCAAQDPHLDARWMWLPL